MSSDTLDPRICREAMDGLKSYRRIEFARRLLKKHGLPVSDKTLQEMWARIGRWIARDPARCHDLRQFVDELRMWGRQRVFLYEVDPDYAAALSDPKFVREQLGDLYQKTEEAEEATEEAEDPFIASVWHTRASDTGHPLLVFKIIENRTYQLAVEGQVRTFEERSTNFFIVDPPGLHAELRIQELPTGATRDAAEEHERLENTVRRYLDFDKLEPIDLVATMDVLLRRPLYAITGSRLKFTEPKARRTDFGPSAPELVAFFKRLFRPPVPAELSGFWKCRQDVLGESRLHFKISGPARSIDFGGIADPARTREILANLVAISRDPKTVSAPGRREPVKNEESLVVRGAVDGILKSLQDQPTAQAVVLSAGAIAASIIWILFEGIGGYVFDETVDRVLHGLPVIVLTIPAEVAWLVFYYGWRRVRSGFEVLLSLPRPEVWRELVQARKRYKRTVAGS